MLLTCSRDVSYRYAINAAFHIVQIILTIKYTALLQAPEQLWFKELADGDIFCQPLSPPCLKYEVACKCLCGRGLERP